MGYKITIDGPAGTGKGTLARELAKQLNILNIDSGMLYRAFGLYVLRNNVNIENGQEIEDTLEKINLKLVQQGETSRVYINNEDVSDLIRTEQVAVVTSKVAKLIPVREYILRIQRNLACDTNVVMEGRDIGSIVFPDAELKIFLTADAKERTRRRYNELINNGKETTFEQVYEQITIRDKEDITREVSPLVKTEDMIEIDTTNMSKEQVVEKVKELVREKGIECF